MRRYGSSRFDISRLEALLGPVWFRELCQASGLEAGGPLELLRLDELGHIAIRKAGTVDSIYVTTCFGDGHQEGALWNHKALRWLDGQR